MPIATPPSNPQGIGQPAIYRIRLQGVLPPAWNDAIQEMNVAYTDSENGGMCTTLTGSVADQAALAGILHLAFMLRMALISVECLGVGDSGPCDRQ